MSHLLLVKPLAKVAVVCLAFPFFTIAGTITLGVGCGNYVVTTGSGSISCSNSFGSAGASASLFSASANAFATPGGPGMQASASSSAVVEVLFTGGTGEAYFVPCLHVSYTALSGSGSATFGNASLGSRLPAYGTCGPVPDGNATLFIYGTPQLDSLYLYAGATAYSLVNNTSGSASFSGFEVFDLNGNLVPSTSWSASVIDVTTPEPMPVTLAVVGLLALAGISARRRPHQQE